MSDLSDKLNNLSPERRELLKLMLAEESVNRTGIVKIASRESQYFPLSFSQQRLWFLSQFDPNSSNYNLPIAVRMKGKFNDMALEESVNEIIGRHESLRTIFREIDDKPTQIVLEDIKITIEYKDYSGLTDDIVEKEALLEARVIVGESFDIAKGPLFRVTVLRLNNEDHIILLTMHHIVSDGWSMGILIEELLVLYQAYSNRKVSPLEPQTLQYVDYTMWQQEWLKGTLIEKQIDYWLKKLNDAPSLLDIPTDFPRRMERKNQGEVSTFYVSEPITNKLNQLCLDEGVTMFMVLITGFFILLSKYSQQTDIKIGTPFANRNRKELETLVGFLVNTLVLRVNVNVDTTILELLSQVKETTLGAFDHPDLPFEMLVEKLQPEREMSYSPVFQVMFAYQNAPRKSHETPGYSMDVLQLHNGSSKFDLTLVMSQGPKRLIGSFEYDSQIFKNSTVNRLADHFIVLLESIVKNPGYKISSISLLTEKEKNQLLHDWNDTYHSIPEHETIPQLFVQQVRRTPDRLAVIYDGVEFKRCITYIELDRKSNQLAVILEKKGIVRGDIVGLFLERSIEMVIGLLGILKSGAAYFPLDPNYPIDRLRYIISDVESAQLKIPQIITTSELKPFLSDMMIDPILLDEFGPDEGKEDSVYIENKNHPNDLAYVIYTSGSTGKPKGVMIEHKNVINLWVGLREKIYGNLEGIGLKVSLNAPLLFDASVQQWVMLLSGETISIVPQELRLDGKRLLDWIISTKLEVLDCVPTQLRMLFEAGFIQKKNELSLKAVLPGGEAIDPDLWFEMSKLPEIKFFNMYGPTECTVDSTICLISDHPEKPSIGSGIVNTRLYILDENKEIVPIGISGELFISGFGVGRGYLNQDNLTKEKFLDDPFSSYGKIYRTGDRARWLDNGKIEYLERIDTQVKIRGFRIELGEIESVLRSHPAVQEAIVEAKVFHTLTSNDRRLVAYIVPEQVEQTDQQNEYLLRELKSFLQEQLPDYMIPFTFKYIPRLPLSPNGKIDRNALPEPDWSQNLLAKEIVLPRTTIEETLSRIWTQVLGIEKIGINEDFFEIGGHSLIAAQMMARVREEFGIEIGLRSVFERPTLEGLAERVREARQAAGKAMPKVEKRKEGERIPLSYGQERLWFLEKFQPGESVYHIPVVMKMKGEIEEKRLEKSLQEIVKRHEVLRSRIVEEGGKAEQVVEGEEWVEENVRMRVEEWKGEEEEKEEIEEEVRRPFDLERGPMVRSLLIKRGEREAKLVVVMHHIVGDGWSMGVMVKEMGKIYRGEEMDEIELQYGDYAVWQREKMGGEVMEEGIRWWKEEMAGQKELNIPTDRERPEVASVKGGRVKLEIGEEEVRGLRKIGREEGATMYMVLKGGLDVLLYRYSGEEEVSVGTVVANRGEVGMEKLIGYFANTIVMRVRVEGREGYRELLRRVKEKALGAYAHGEVPFERVVSEIGVERNTSRTPLFGVMFVLQNVPMGKLELAGIEMEAEEVELGRVPFELSVVMEEREGKLEGVIEYNEGLYDRSTIERMARHYEEILKGVVKGNGEEAVGKMRLMSEREEKRILEEWNETYTEIPEENTIAELFQAQAKMMPEQIAISYREEGKKVNISYRELEEKTTELAEYLEREGVKPGTIVGLSLERTAQLYIGLLGILKSGSGFLPLDPTYPKERLEYMIADTGIEYILTQRSLEGQMPDQVKRKIIIDGEWEKEKGQRGEREKERKGDLEGVAYIMYTSGSTGKPKGVMITHRSLINHNYGVKRLFELTERDRVLQFATINFDTSMEEIFPTWLSGATLVVPPREKIRKGSLLITGKELNELIEEEKITILDLPTAFWHEWVYEQSMTKEKISESLRLVVVGGEKSRRDRYEMWREVNERGIRWINTYGPTEGTIIATAYEPKGEIEKGKEIPIGKPLGNVKIYILDENKRAVPIGVAGELYIGGKGVAKGYKNHPELEEGKFIANPYKEGERMYGTGDWGKWLEDGNIEYLGRRDNQKKVRGYRIELEEIEKELMRNPEVREAVAMIYERGGEGKERIVAFVVGGRSEKEMTKNMRNRLPEYMIPSSIVTIEEMPKLPNGKINRNNLIGKIKENEGKQEYLEPRNETERELTKIWGEVLGIEKVGIGENFFELGGDSILSLQMVAKAREKGLGVTVQDIFESQTIQELALKVGETKRVEAEQGTVTGEYELTPIQSWFFEQEFTKPEHWNQSILVEVNERMDKGILGETVKKILKQHDGLRTKFKKENGEWKAEIMEEVEKEPLQIVEIREKGEEEYRKQVEGMQKGLEIERGALIQFGYFDFGERRKDRIFIVIHHLLTDVVSWRILLEDFWRIYGELTRGGEAKLRKTTSYKKWAERLREYANTAQVQSEYDYWEQETREEYETREVDNIEGKNNEAEVKRKSVKIEAEKTKAFTEVMNEKYRANIQTGLVACLFVSNSRWSGKQEMMIEVESHGRQESVGEVDVSRTIGWFTSLYPVTLKMKGKREIEEITKYVKEKMVKVPNQGIGYGLLRYLNEKTNKRLKKIHIPISFNYLGQMNQEREGDRGLRISREYGGRNISEENGRNYQLEINCGIANEQLSVDIIYSGAQYSTTTIDELASHFKTVIDEMIEVSGKEKEVGYTPSDFPLAGVDQSKLNRIIRRTRNE